MSRADAAGFTLMEVLVALSLLSVGLLALAMAFPVLVRLGNQSQVAGGALQTAQRELEQVRRNIFSPSGTYTDMDGNALDSSCSGAPGTSCGNPLTSDGTIDYSQAAAVGYSVQLRDGSGQIYSVRWHVTVTASNGRKILLGSKPVSPAAGLPIPVHLVTLVAR